MRALASITVAATLLAATSAAGDLLGTKVTLHDLGPPGTSTYRVHLEFDGEIPLDQLLFVQGLPGPGPIAFRTNTVLVNDGGLDAGTRAEDFPSATAAPWDSWVTLGTKEPSPDLRFTPWFLGAGDICKIEGSDWHEHDGGWYDADPDSGVMGGMVLIAQLTVTDDPLGNPGHVRLEGFAEWWDGSDDGRRTRAFSARSAPFGTCCLPDATCVVVSPGDCHAAGGEDHGDDVACDTDTCASLPCLADVDGDGLVGVTDLVAILTAWGEGGTHPADVDGDGAVDVNDLTAVITSWGDCP